MKKNDVILPYQGGKVSIASVIVDNIDVDDGARFYDLCCGTGAVSIELVSRGFTATQIEMIDAGPWGLFWEKIANNNFDFDAFDKYISQVPKDLNKVRDFIKELSKQPAEINTVEVFLLLQANSFGGKAISIDNGKWKHSGFRGFWQPTKTSNRGSPVKPMIDPDRLIKRIENVSKLMCGISAKCMDVNDAEIADGSVVYVDPPYDDTTGYAYSLDAVSLAKRISKTSTCYVSEGKPVSEDACKIFAVRPKGGISGSRKIAHEEWLSKFSKI